MGSRCALLVSLSCRRQLLLLQGLVVEDLSSALPPWLLHVPHIIVRRGEGELLRDAQLKLRCANATHTAIVYTMALSACTSVAAACAAHPQLLLFLDRLYDADISSLPRALQLPEADVKAFYAEWRARVASPSVDMSPFWVAQNAVAKVATTMSFVFQSLMSFVLQCRRGCARIVRCLIRAVRLASAWFPPFSSTAARPPA